MRLNRRSAAKLLVAPAVMAGLRTFAGAGTPTEFADFMTLDIGRYTRLAQDMGLGED